MVDDDNHSSRRDVLGGITTLGVIGVAGCLGGDGNGGGGNGGGGNGDGGDGYSLVVGTSGSGTPTEQAGQALARATNEHSNINLTVQNTDGWTANLFEYDQGNIPAMGVDNNSLSMALNETGPFEEEPVDSMPHQGFIYTNLDIHMVAVEGSGVESVADLREGGYTIYPLQPGAGTRSFTVQIYEEAGLLDVNETVNVDFSDIAGAVEEGRVDVVTMYGVNGVNLSGWCEEVDVRSNGQLNLIELDDEFRQVIEDHPGGPLVETEPYGYEQDVTGITDTLVGWQLVGQWAFGSEVPADVSYEIARVSSEHWETIQDADPTALDHSGVESMTEGVIPEIPIHPGVADYWEEHDVWNEEWERGEVDE